MSYSFTITETGSFTITHARHIAAKVATDLKRMQRFYQQPSDRDIDDYEEEIVALLKNGYLGKVAYGFKRNGNWIEPTLKYTARELANDDGTNDDPGKISPRASISGAAFYSYLTYSAKWNNLSGDVRENFKKLLPFYRTGADEPGVAKYGRSAEGSRVDVSRRG